MCAAPETPEARSAAKGAPFENASFDAISYLTTPRWQKVSLGLERTRVLLAALGNPQDALRFVHVAGTNGKGSTCAMLASILQEAGYRVGLFTSPALYTFEERIRVNGVPIAPDQLREVTLKVKAAADAITAPVPEDPSAETAAESAGPQLLEHPTEFELLTAVAFCHFAEQQCDIVIAEVGLGGRLDSTNVIERVEASVITPISFDHCALLGNTLVEIAREKAGIIKPHVPVVCAPQQPEVLEVIEQEAQANKAPFKLVDLQELRGRPANFSYRTFTGLELGLFGSFQLVNAATVLDTIDTLRARGWAVFDEAIRRGLAQARWSGRFEVVSEDPLVILDGGHNVAGMQALVQALDETYPHYQRIMLTGVLADKDYAAMAALLVSTASEIITVAPNNPRALDTQDYAHTLEQAAMSSHRSIPITPASSIEVGVHQAIQRYAALSHDAHNPASTSADPPLICVCGSLYLLGSVMEVLRQAGVAL